MKEPQISEWIKYLNKEDQALLRAIDKVASIKMTSLDYDPKRFPMRYELKVRVESSENSKGEITFKFNTNKL